ncbi:MAG: hypothetical protein ACMG6S_00605 [Byssovorax sp.]
MKKVDRLPLSETTLDFLWKRRLRIVEAGDKAPRQSERRAAQYKEADDLWGGSYKSNKAFEEIRTTLRAMAPGHELCMYCEYIHGNAIEHFAPMEKYPTSAFAWDNYLWSCTDCNSKYKGTQFPLDERGLPLLVNPTRDEPREHIGVSPLSGKVTGLTAKGSRTIKVLGFDRRGYLEKSRSSAWRAIQHYLVSYDEACTEGDEVRAMVVKTDLCQYPHASLLSLLIEVLEKPGGALLVAERRCGPILATYPEIKSWI